MSADEVFNRKDMMARVMGDEMLLELLLEGYVVEIEQQLKTIRENCEEENLDVCAKALHTIKGCAANMSANELRKASLALEKKAKDKDIEAVRHGVSELEGVLAKLKAKI